MDYKQNIEHCFGAGRLNEADVKMLKAEASEHLKATIESKNNGLLPIISLAEHNPELEQIEKFATKLKNEFENLVVLGIGGSSLCGHALTGFCQEEYAFKLPRVIFIQNIDPTSISNMFDGLNIKKTAFLAISKSGTSIETLVQLGVCVERAKKAGVANLATNFFVITMASTSPLRRFAENNQLTCFEHGANIGGRFSIFSNVGLIPAIVAGMNVKKLYSGATYFLHNLSHLAAESAAIHVALMRKNIWQNVLMTYSDRLEDTNIWYRQIWSESLGKNGTGSTPIKALGTIDQHSQLQIYLDGRKDKFFTFITEDFAKKGDVLTALDPENNFLSGKYLGDVIGAEQLATIETLAAAKRPVRVIETNQLHTDSLGAIIMHLMLETIITARLLGVNPFDQPAVEDGKIRTRKILGDKI